MASYNNIYDILKQFELQVVQQKHYLKSETFTKSEVNSAISTAIAGVNQFGIVKATSASNTPNGVTWNNGSTTITGTLTAANADSHTIYFVKSTNGTNDVFDEYMVQDGAWEKIGNTDVDLSGYVQTTRKVNGHALSADVTVSKSDVGLGSVTNVATESTITSGSSKNITSGAVYTALNNSVTSSSHGVALGGKVNAPTVTVTPGSIASGNDSVVTGGAVYSYAQPLDSNLTAVATALGLHDDDYGMLWKNVSGTIEVRTPASVNIITTQLLQEALQDYATTAYVGQNFATASYVGSYVESYDDDVLSGEYVAKDDFSISDANFTTMLSEV